MTEPLPDLLLNGPTDAPLTLALAHGAGAPMDSPFMEAFALGVAEAGFQVARFEFPYMAQRRVTGKKSPPNRQPILLQTWRTVIDHFGADKLVIGGKSMGGRMATLIADDEKPRGVICLGYPFHPPGKPEKTRTEHLLELETPTLICQGTRDSLGGLAAVEGYELSKAIQLHWLEDGDHSLKPRKKSGRTEAQNWDEAMAEMIRFMKSL